MQVPQRRQRSSLKTGKRFSSSSMAPKGHSTVQRLHWVQVAQGRGGIGYFGQGRIVGLIGIDVLPVQAGTAQKPCVGVVVVEDHFKRQAHGLIAMACKLHQQAIGLVQLEAPVGRGMQFFEIGAFEVVAFDGLF